MSIELHLPCGVETLKGVIRNVCIRKLKGRAQREIARVAGKKNPNPASVLDTVLLSCVESIGEDMALLANIRKMFVADRDWLMVQGRVATWGPFVSVEGACEEVGCGKKWSLSDVNIEDFPVTHIGYPDEFTALKESDILIEPLWWDGSKPIPEKDIPGGVTAALDRLAFRVFVLENPDLGACGVFRYPTGLEQESVGRFVDQPVEVVWRLMSSGCVSWIDPDNSLPTIKIGTLSPDFWEDVDLDILDWAQVAYKNAQPGVDTSMELQCPGCGVTTERTVQPSDFLFPEQNRKKSRSTVRD